MDTGKKGKYISNLLQIYSKLLYIIIKFRLSITLRVINFKKKKPQTIRQTNYWEIKIEMIKFQEMTKMYYVKSEDMEGVGTKKQL